MADLKSLEFVKNKKSITLGAIVVLLALAVGINSQFPAFVNKYVINDDVSMHIYWMQQFRDGDLFRGDLLTEYAKHFQPWGFILFYYVLSFVVDPITLSKVLPLVLFLVFSLFVFKLVKYVSDIYTGFLAALIFMITPFFLLTMVGGHARAFGYPLMVAFLYYLIKKDYLKTSVVLVLQSLFYPMVFMLSMLTYAFTFIKIDNKKVVFDKSASKWKFFILAVVLCGTLLWAKYPGSYNTSFGPPATKKQMVNHPEFYAGGRSKILPTDPLLQAVKVTFKFPKFPSLTPAFLRKYPKLSYKTTLVIQKIVLLITALFFMHELFKKKWPFPPEIFIFFLSAILMYKMADLMLFKLYIPSRYLKYSIPLVSLTIFTLAVGQSIRKIRKERLKKTFQIMVIILAVLSFDRSARRGLIDDSYNKDLYEYLKSLPKNAMIAAHPHLSDNIPTFAQRKVFVSSESPPIHTGYWEIVKKRTFDFFDAYYSENFAPVYEFCEENGIDYLIVDKRHFTKEYIGAAKIYFEPFNSYIVKSISKRQSFALDSVPQEDKVFVRGDIFIIDKNALK